MSLQYPAPLASWTTAFCTFSSSVAVATSAIVAEVMLQTDASYVIGNIDQRKCVPKQGISTLQVRSGVGQLALREFADPEEGTNADDADEEAEMQWEMAADAKSANETMSAWATAPAQKESERVQEVDKEAKAVAEENDQMQAFGAARHMGCLPSSTKRANNGYVDSFRGWYDVQGCGRCHDYCRWVGGSGSGGDPMANVIHKDSWWSCRLAGSALEYSYNGFFTSWNLARCTSEGAIAPSIPPAPTPYVPGEPGAPWTLEELLSVRAKLHRIINEGAAVYHELGLATVDDFWGAMPGAAKMLRLGFHDCLRYVDGTPFGCDGCLEWNGVGERFPFDRLAKGQFPFTDDGHNNGLKPTVEVLEGIYTDRAFPSLTPQLSISLQRSGKSRADLWAFATMVAVEYSITLNNLACDNPELVPDQCHPRINMPDCKVEMVRPFSFRTGRRDCVSTGFPWKHSSSPSYMTMQRERHPDPQSNGSGTVEFFRRDFGFTGRETVAIMGAHTLGRVHVIISMFRYTWKARSNRLFNNGYYRNLVGKPDWFYPTEETACVTVGNADGKRPKARWLAHVRGDTSVGGPVQWLQEKLVCPTCGSAHLGSEDLDCCTRGVPAGRTCRPDCEKWKFVLGNDEQALPCEMGLYKAFNVDHHMIPYGCPGFKDFNMGKWGGFRYPAEGLKNYDYTWTLIDGKKAPPECPFNELAEPAGTTPLYQIVEEYANDWRRWFSDFFPALEKMLGNGYATSELELAPLAGMAGVSCPLQNPYDSSRFYQCTAFKP